MESLKIYLCDIRALAPMEEKTLVRLTPERRTKAASLRFKQDRLHCIAAGLLMSHILGINDDRRVCIGRYGKPELIESDFSFSLSHSGNYAALALFKGPVGVDIEPVGDSIPLVPRQIFLEDELKYLDQSPSPERFAVLWTRLESALKAEGRGFEPGQRSYSVLSDTESWHIETTEHDGHVISVAANRPFKPEIILLDPEKMI